MKYLRLAFCIVIGFAHEWLFFVGLWPLVDLPISPFLVGAVVGVPLALEFRRTERSPITGKWITNAPRWLWLFGNDEDGFCSLEARSHYKPGWPLWLNMWWWGSIRNPVGNWRFMKALYPPPQQSRIRYMLGSNWALTWQGWRHHLGIIGSKKVYTIGWKYYPSDAQSGAEYGWRKFGCGFALRRRDREPEDAPINV